MEVLRQRRVLSWASSLVLTIAVLGAGCAPAPSPPAGGGGGGGGGGGSLLGRSFLVTSATENGQPRPLLPGARIELSVSSERIGAKACNSIGAPVLIEPSRLVVDESQMVQTMMSCGPAVDAQEDWFTSFLGADPAYSLHGDRLRLEVGATVIELLDREVADPDRPLRGTVWWVEGMTEGTGTWFVPLGSAATVTFSNRSVGFWALWCNTGSGDAVIGDSTIEIGPLTQTLVACWGPSASMEAWIVGVLQGTITYDIQSDVLRLMHPSGRGLVLRAAA